MSPLANLLGISDSKFPTVTRNIDTEFSTVSYPVWMRAIELWLLHSKELLSAQPLRPCPACGENNSVHLYTSYDGHPFHACLECSCWFEPHLVDEKLFLKLMEICPEAKKCAEDMAKERLALPSAINSDEERFAQLLEMLDSFTPASVLDIGANAGQFVATAKEKGWTAWGLENDSFALAEAKARGRQVVDSPGELPSEAWNMLTMWETVEHVADPYGLLSTFEKSLAPGAALVFTFPNLNNLQLQQMRGNCSFSHGGYNTAGHINLFGVKQFTKLLNRVGLEPVFWDGCYASDYALQWGYLLGKTAATDLKSKLSAMHTLEYPAIIDQLSPGLAFMERTSLTTPILLCVACRSTEKHLLQTQINKLENLRKLSLEKQRDEILVSYGLASAASKTISFTLHEPKELRILICGNNYEPEKVGIIVDKAWITSNKIKHHAKLEKVTGSFGLSENISHFKKNKNDSILLASQEIKYDTFLQDHAVLLKPGEYLLQIEAQVFLGRASVGLLDENSREWFVPPVDLGTSSSSDTFLKFLDCVK